MERNILYGADDTVEFDGFAVSKKGLRIGSDQTLTWEQLDRIEEFTEKLKVYQKLQSSTLATLDIRNASNLWVFEELVRHYAKAKLQYVVVIPRTQTYVR